MFRRLDLKLVLLCFLLAGCVSADSALIVPNARSQDLEETLRVAYGSASEPDDSDVLSEIASHDREFSRHLLRSASRGSMVALVDQSGRRYMGTLLRASADSIDLMNCVCRETVPGPDGRKQCKTSHMPFQTLKTAPITYVIVLAEPQEERALQELTPDGRDVTIDAIVFKSGRRHQRGRPPDRAEQSPSAE